MVAFYLTVLILTCMIWYAGIEGTLRVFVYIDLELRYLGIKFKMWRMRRDLEKKMGYPPQTFTEFLEEYNNDR